MLLSEFTCSQFYAQHSSRKAKGPATHTGPLCDFGDLAEANTNIGMEAAATDIEPESVCGEFATAGTVIGGEVPATDAEPSVRLR